MSRVRVPLHFGPGLDRAVGPMAVEPGAMEDLRNFYLLDEKLQARKGFISPGVLSVDDVPQITHVLEGQALRAESVGIVVGWASVAGEVHVFRVRPDGSESFWLGKWFDYEMGDDEETQPPIIFMTECFGRVFMAHDEPAVTERAPTLVYDPVTPQDGLLSPLSVDWDEGQGGSGPVRFRGVVTHLDYLVGWGFGTPMFDRPELVRASMPGEPRNFHPKHYWIVGDRRDPVLQCEPGVADLVAFKGGEWHALTGSSRFDFGQVRRDPLHGLLHPRLAVNVSGEIFFWAADGPRVTDGRGPSESLEIPLDLKGFEPADLPDEGDICEAFATYSWRDRVVLFVFGRRVYALTIQKRGEWKWSYWTLPWPAFCAFTLWDSVFSRRGEPIGYPIWESEEAAGTFVDIEVGHEGQLGDEILEVWLRNTDTENPWYLATATDVSVTTPQTVRASGLEVGANYVGALRYRRGAQVAAGYTGDPGSWPAVSQGEFTTALNPPELGQQNLALGARFAATGDTDWVWERTASDAHYLQFRIKPDETSGVAGHKIKIFRATGGGAYSEIAELTEGSDFNGTDAFLWKDNNPPQGDWLSYRASTVVGASESPRSLTLRLWAGPQPELLFVMNNKVPATRSVFIEANRLTYDHRCSNHRLQEVVTADHSAIRFYDNWNTAVPEYTAEPDQDRGTITNSLVAEPIDQQPPDFGRVAGAAIPRKTVSLGEALPAGSTLTVAVRFESTRFGITDVSDKIPLNVAVP